MRKLQPLTIKGVQELKKKKTIDHYKGWFSNTQKIPCTLSCCY
jgi:hypothetical protein